MLRATQTFFARGRYVEQGEEVDPTDPIVEDRGHLFEVVVEEATANPGEKRSVSKRTTTKRTTKAKD